MGCVVFVKDTRRVRVKLGLSWVGWTGRGRRTTMVAPAECSPRREDRSAGGASGVWTEVVGIGRAWS